MMIQAPLFPTVILELPLSFVVSQLPRLQVDSTSVATASTEEIPSEEPIVDLHSIVESMKPPACFGLSRNGSATPLHKPMRPDRIQTTPSSWLAGMRNDASKTLADISAEDFFQGLADLNELFVQNHASPAIAGLQRSVLDFIDTARKFKPDELTVLAAKAGSHGSKSVTKPVFNSWALLKNHGEQVISSVKSNSTVAAGADWRRAIERIYKYLVSKSSGRGATIVLSDLRCNGHLTGTACFERSVRLPAALKAVRLAGASADGPLKLMLGVDEAYIKLAEEHVLPKVHTASYLKRMKGRCESAVSEDAIIRLTDDSDGRGGEDTSKYTIHEIFTNRSRLSKTSALLRSGLKGHLVGGCLWCSCRVKANGDGCLWRMHQWILRLTPSWSPCWTIFASNEGNLEWILRPEYCCIYRNLCDNSDQ